MEDQSDETSDGSCSSEDHDGGLGNGLQENDVGNGSRVARMIGGLPIAEYAESPRRYGPPRPGFPQVFSFSYHNFIRNKNRFLFEMNILASIIRKQSFTSTSCTTMFSSIVHDFRLFI